LEIPKEVDMRVRTLLFGGLVGAAIAYYFDPVAGRGRRTRLRDQAMAEARRMVAKAERRGRYLGHMAEGKLAELRSPGPDRTDVDDVVIAQRIHSDVLGRADVPKDRLTVDVAGGVATLRGELDSQVEIDDVASRVRGIAGVQDVDVLIHLPSEPAPNKEAAIEASRRAARRSSEPSSG
jgi:osmotically-inducible protein OsmY